MCNNKMAITRYKIQTYDEHDKQSVPIFKRDFLSTSFANLLHCPHRL